MGVSEDRKLTTCYRKNKYYKYFFTDFWYSQPPHPIANLVLHSDLSSQGVVGVPLFREGQSMLCPFVLCLQGSRDLTGLSVGRACAGELLQMREFYCVINVCEGFFTPCQVLCQAVEL